MLRYFSDTGKPHIPNTLATESVLLCARLRGAVTGPTLYGCLCLKIDGGSNFQTQILSTRFSLFRKPELCTVKVFLYSVKSRAINAIP